MSVSREAMAELTQKFEEAGVIEKTDESAAAEGDEHELESGEEAGQIEGEEAAAEELEGAEGDEEGEEAAQGAEGEGDETETYTPAALAEAIGWEANDLYDSLLVPIGGEGESIPLGEIKHKYQEVTSENKNLQTQVERLQAGQTDVQQGQQMSQEMIQLQGYYASLQRMEQQTNWKELEEQDPTEAMLKKQKLNDAKKEVEGHMQQVYQQQQVARGQMLQQAQAKMIEDIPSWSDKAAMKSDQDVIRSRMKEVGFVDTEINQIADPRTMVLLKELIDLRAEKVAAQGAVKKVRKAPKVLRGAGGRFKKSDSNKAAAKVARDKARQTGSRHDEVAAVKALLQSQT